MAQRSWMGGKAVEKVETQGTLRLPDLSSDANHHTMEPLQKSLLKKRHVWKWDLYITFEKSPDQ